MPNGWSPRTPLMFEGRELCDELGQPLRLVRNPFARNLQIVDSRHGELDLNDIKLLCKSKYGRLEKKNDKYYYRGRPVNHYISATLYDESIYSIRRGFAPDDSLYKADLKWLNCVMDNNDIEAFKQLLEEFPTVWKYSDCYNSLDENLAYVFF